MPLRERRILLVEDEWLIASAIAADLRRAGALVEMVGTLQEALDAAEADHDVAVLDINLGKEQVFAAADRLQKRGVPFLFHTSESRTDDMVQRYPLAPVLKKMATHQALAEALLGIIRPQEIGHSPLRSPSASSSSG